MAYMMKFPRQIKKELGGETMENKNGKVIAIAALVVAVVALSVGFAAFSDTLTIDGAATANASGDAFDATSNNGLNYKSATGKCYLTSDNSKTALAGADAGNLATGGGNGVDTWSGISVPLGSSAKDVTCEAIVENKSAYKAFLTGLSTAAGLTCASTGANATTNQTNVCAATTVTVSINDGTNTDSMSITNAAASSSTKTVEINPTNGEATVTVRINYAGADTDQDTTITIPTITHAYSSVGHTGS